MILHERPRISVYIATSLDGYIARMDGALDWLERMNQMPGEDYGYKQFLSSIDTIVIGRGTYEVASSVAVWPYEGKRVVVLSRTLHSVCIQAELFSGDILSLVKRLHEEGVKHIYADGGMTVSQFLNAGIVDQLTISLIPVVIGSGIPLFSNIHHDKWCRLISSHAYENGLMQLQYALT